MDITAIRNDPDPEGRIFQEILPHMNTKSAIAVHLNRKRNKQLDPLSAVKLDPSVLEAQITIDTSAKNKHRPAAFIKTNMFSDVKLDPSVLEAQITIDTSAKNEHSPAALTKKKSLRRLDFDKAMCMQRAALMSLSGQQLNLLMQYVDTLRLQRYSAQKRLVCAFCKNNGHSEVWYTNHALRDGKGRVRCPLLREMSCRRCGATGDHAHTITYCPHK